METILYVMVYLHTPCQYSPVSVHLVYSSCHLSSTPCYIFILVYSYPKPNLPIRSTFFKREKKLFLYPYIFKMGFKYNIVMKECIQFEFSFYLSARSASIDDSCLSLELWRSFLVPWHQMPLVFFLTLR